MLIDTTRNITWFNPCKSKNLKANVGRYSLNPYTNISNTRQKIFNRNSKNQFQLNREHHTKITKGKQKSSNRTSAQAKPTCKCIAKKSIFDN